MNYSRMMANARQANKFPEPFVERIRSETSFYNEHKRSRHCVDVIFPTLVHVGVALIVAVVDQDVVAPKGRFTLETVRSGEEG